MTFQILMKDATVLKNLFKAMSLIDEPILFVDKDGMKLRMMDAAHVVMTDMDIPAKVFEAYECTEPEVLVFNRKDMTDSLSRVSVGQSVGLAIDKNKLAVVVIGKSEKTFFINLLVPIDGTGKLMDRPNIDLKGKVKIDVETLKDDVDDINSALGKEDFVAIKLDSKTFSMSGAGQRRGVSVVGRDSILSINCEEEQQSSYGIAYLKEIVEDGASLSGVVNITFRTDYPIKFDFELPFQGTLTYLLAPRTDKPPPPLPEKKKKKKAGEEKEDESESVGDKLGDDLE